MVGMSVFNWRTLPDLWLTCDQIVGKVSAMGQPARPTQPSIPSGSVNGLRGWRSLNGRPGLCTWWFSCENPR